MKNISNSYTGIIYFSCFDGNDQGIRLDHATRNLSIMECNVSGQIACTKYCEGDRTYNYQGNCPVRNIRLLSVGENVSVHEQDLSHGYSYNLYGYGKNNIKTVPFRESISIGG